MEADWSALDGLGGGGSAPSPSPESAETSPAPTPKIRKGRAPKPLPKKVAPAAAVPAENEPRAAAAPENSAPVDQGEAADRERRRKRTNWNLREAAVGNLPRGASRIDWDLMPLREAPMSFNARIGQVSISNEELQKSGWSADMFARHERQVDEAGAERGARLKARLEAELAATRDEAAAEASQVSAETATAEQAERFARIVDGNEADDAATAPPARLKKVADEISPDEMALLDRALEAPTSEEFFDRYHAALKAAGLKDRGRMMRAFREKHAGATLDEIKEAVRGEIAEHAPGARPAAPATEPKPAGAPRENPAFTLSPDEAAALGRTLNASSFDELLEGYRAMAVAAGEKNPARFVGSIQRNFSPDDLPAIKDFIREQLRRRGVSPESVGEKPLPPNRDRHGNPIDVEIAEPGAVLSPAAKRKLHAKFAAKDAAHAPARRAAANDPATLTPEEAAEVGELRHAKVSAGDEDEASVRQLREKMEAALRESRTGRRRVRQQVENPAFTASIRMKRKKGGNPLSSDEVRAEGDRLVREQAEAEAELAAKIPAADDDGSRARAAVSAAAAEASVEPGGGDPYEKLYETLRREAPLVFGSSSEYTPEMVAEIVEAIRRGDGSATLDDLPATFGIRQAVASIRDKERRAALLADLHSQRTVEADATVLPPTAPVTPAAAAGNPWTTASRAAAAPRQPNAATNPWTTASRTRAPGASPRQNGNPWTTAANAAPGGAGGGAGTPPPPPGNVPPPPAGGPNSVPVPPPPPPPRRNTGLGSRLGRAARWIGTEMNAGATELAAGALGILDQYVARPAKWLWDAIELDGTGSGKENPFAKDKTFFFPFRWGWSSLWHSVGGLFGAKFETPKEDKKK